MSIHMNKQLHFIFGISIIFACVCIHTHVTSVSLETSATRKQMLDEVKKSQESPLLPQVVFKDGGSNEFSSGDLGSIAKKVIDEHVARNTIKKPQEEVAPIEGMEPTTTSSTGEVTRFRQPWQLETANQTIDILFENMELSNFISYIGKQFGLTFILNDAIQPLPADTKGSVMGSRITFTSYKSLNKKQAWDLFIQFLDIAGLAAVAIDETTYRITTSDPKSPRAAQRNPLPTYFNVELSELPDNDSLIRYVYFVENASPEIISSVVVNLCSSIAGAVILVPEIKALVITDKARSIRQILTIVYELDRVSSPETVAIIKLKHADAVTIADLYNKSLMPDRPQDLNARLMGARKTSTVSYFPEGTRVIAEPRTNSLILLGQSQAIKKIEDFIVHQIDKQVTLPSTPLHTYELKYTDATAVAAIINDVVKFQGNSSAGADAAKYGGVRDGEKYFKNVTVIAEKSGNRLVISGSYEDFEKIKELIERIDIEQPQVALKIFIYSIETTDIRGLGCQLRNMKPALDGVLGKTVNFQTSGMTTQGVIENPYETISTTPVPSGGQRLLGNLINLVSGVGSAGNTLVTLGCDAFGVWGMLRMLQSYSNVSLITNPFIVTTNRYPATIATGEIRRVVTAYTQTSGNPAVPTYDDLTAQIQVKVTPQISYEELVTLSINVVIDTFTGSSANTATAGNRTTRVINSSVITKNNEMIALGGILKDSTSESETHTPLLHKIPILGWLFRNKNKEISKTFLLVLITPELVPMRSEGREDSFTSRTVRHIKTLLNDEGGPSRDPIDRWFFKSGKKQRGLHQAMLLTQDHDEPETEKKENNDLGESIQDMVVLEKPEYKTTDQDTKSK